MRLVMVTYAEDLRSLYIYQLLGDGEVRTLNRIPSFNVPLCEGFTFMIRFLRLWRQSAYQTNVRLIPLNILRHRPSKFFPVHVQHSVSFL
jgi:hypothetical protein